MKQSVKVCPNCNAENTNSAEECAFCGEDLTDIEPEVDDDDTMEEPYDDTEDDDDEDIVVYSRFTGSKVARFLSWAVGIIGAISGRALGDTFKIVTPHYNEILEEIIYDEKFNSGLMLTTWFATAIIVLAFVLCYFHFKNQETMLKNQVKTNKLLRQIAKK